MEELKAQLKKAFEEVVLPQVELQLEKAINEKLEPALDAILKIVAEKIPGQLDDIAIAALKPEMVKILKAALLAQAEKVSDKV